MVATGTIVICNSINITTDYWNQYEYTLDTVSLWSNMKYTPDTLLCMNRQQYWQEKTLERKWQPTYILCICHSALTAMELLTLLGKRTQIWTLAPIGASILRSTYFSQRYRIWNNEEIITIGSPHRVGFICTCSDMPTLSGHAMRQGHPRRMV